jgi:hypothetical protein
MRVRTSDGIILNGFEQVKEIVKKVQNTKIMQNVAREAGDRQVRYNGHSIQVNAYGELKEQIQNLLRDMSQRSMQRKVYSGNSSTVFQESFAKRLKFLLAWLGCMRYSSGVSSLMMKDALKWLKSVVTRMRCPNADLICIKNMVNQL